DSSQFHSIYRARTGPPRCSTLDATVADIPILSYGRENPGGHTGMELRRVGWTVLSRGNSTGGFSDDLLARVRHGGGRLDVLRHAGRQDRAGLGAANAGGFRLRA